MGLNDYGTQGMLKKRLAKYMDYIEKDDKVRLKKEIEYINRDLFKIASC